MKSYANNKRHAGDGSRLGRELLGLFAIFCGLLVTLSLATFDSRDPWLNHVVSGVTRVHNKAGLFGSYLSGFLFDIMGAASWLLPASLCLAGARRILGVKEWLWWRWMGFVLLGFCVSLAGAAGDLGDVEIFARGVLPQGAGNVSTHGGGIIGHMAYVSMVGWLSSTGTFLIWLFSLLLAMQMLTGLSWLALLIVGGRVLRELIATWLSDLGQRYAERKEARLARAARNRELKDVTGQAPLEITAYPLESPLPGNQGIVRETTPLVVAPVGENTVLPQPAVSPASGVAGGGCFEETAERLPVATAIMPAAFSDEPEGAFAASFFAVAREESTPKTDPKDASRSSFPAFFLPTPGKSGKLEEEDDLPPWVRDFEQDRLGVQPHQSGLPAAGPGETTANQAMDTARFTWTREGAADASACASDSTVERPSLASETKKEEAEEAVQGTTAAPYEQLHLSVQTAAAVEALRAAGKADPYQPAQSNADSMEFLSAPVWSGSVFPVHSDTADLEQAVTAQGWADVSSLPESAAREEPPAQSVGAKERELGADSAAASVYSGTVHIFETPPVEAAPKPGVLNSLARHLMRASRVHLPPLDLLQAAVSSGKGTPRDVLEAKGRSLMTCLNDFGIQGELVGITPGPVVTMFELRPAPGVRVSRIANLSDDLALALKAVAVRIQAPVPGTDTVGIEIPNEIRETVCLKELLSSQIFQQSKSLLTLALGKDIAGIPAVADLATMPHLLVAGATGAGKSVGINSIILSIIYKARPEEVKLLLVDPKRVEMAIYADLPHLVHPVVTEMQLAKNALEWAVAEMEQRYDAIAKAGVRNITDYNAKLASFGDKALPSGMEDLEFMPYLVIIIDELADLMLVAAKEVETSIVRLAQLARAAGIHLILATQRPSVDVVTGLIKANFPCRISFQVTSKHDSRTILDTVGAEHLLGRGDMLFKPGGGKFKRMHGAFVSDENVNAVVDYWKSQQRPDYQIDFSDWAPEGAGGAIAGNGGGGDIAGDPMYHEAVEFVRQQGKASISLIQRKFRIGFNKAARFVEQMEMDGIIGPADGSKPRVVLR